MGMANDKQFTFEISLNILNHLGRNLYRNFTTVLGEAISNSWDADANNVWIYVDKDNNKFFVKDDGEGMSPEDFQHKFLKVGYSKRSDGSSKSKKGRPYIGRKGIGKLALLSCADRIAIISKKAETSYTGGLVDNSDLDNAIKKDLDSSQYPLENYDSKVFKKYTTKGHKKGTIIYFENVKDGAKNSFKYLRKIIALYFRFSLLDPNFNIFINNKKVTINDLKDLAKETEFLWVINGLEDPYVSRKLTTLKGKKEVEVSNKAGKIEGFVASVTRPRYLKITNSDEKVSIDLFVNGRLRETNVLRSIPSDRIAADYLYGQIHFNILDDKEEDRFTTAREGIMPNDAKYEAFLEILRPHLSRIYDEWDKLRTDNRKPGDPERTDVPRTQRASKELYNAVFEGYEVPEKSKSRSKVDKWMEELRADAQYNFESYADCFIGENLIRKHIEEKNIPLSEKAKEKINSYKKKEDEHKNIGNISIGIRKMPRDISFLSMDDLAYLVDNVKPSGGTKAGLSRDADAYKPMRDAVMHTALLTETAKKKLTSVVDNVKGRIRTLLS